MNAEDAAIWRYDMKINHTEISDSDFCIARPIRFVVGLALNTYDDDDDDDDDSD